MTGVRWCFLAVMMVCLGVGQVAEAFSDLYFTSMSVSEVSWTANQTYSAISEIGNRGFDPSDGTQMHYVFSTASSILPTDDKLDSLPDPIFVSPILFGNLSRKVATVTAPAPATLTTYWIGACVVPPANEHETYYLDDCSVGVKVTVSPLPEVRTRFVTGIYARSATGNGTIDASGYADPDQHGVCWNTTGNPELVTDSCSTDGPISTGMFASNINALIPHTTYYVQAYATNSSGTAYGSQVSFTTPSEVPVLETDAVSDIEKNSATGNGRITQLGTSNPSQHGTCWNTSGNPTVGDSCTTQGTTTTGSFSSSLSGLKTKTTYYARAYATNGSGTGYGSQVSFTTNSFPWAMFMPRKVVELPDPQWTVMTGLCCTLSNMTLSITLEGTTKSSTTTPCPVSPTVEDSANSTEGTKDFRYSVSSGCLNESGSFSYTFRKGRTYTFFTSLDGGHAKIEVLNSPLTVNSAKGKESGNVEVLLLDPETVADKEGRYGGGLDIVGECFTP